MKNRSYRPIGFLPLLWLFLFFPITFQIGMVLAAESTSPRETLKQYVAELQNHPDDQALREKIIKLVQTMKPAPAIPEEARRPFVKADTTLKK